MTRRPHRQLESLSGHSHQLHLFSTYISSVFGTLPKNVTNRPIPGNLVIVGQILSIALTACADTWQTSPSRSPVLPPDKILTSLSYTGEMQVDCCQLCLSLGVMRYLLLWHDLQLWNVRCCFKCSWQHCTDLAGRSTVIFPTSLPSYVVEFLVGQNYLIFVSHAGVHTGMRH